MTTVYTFGLFQSGQSEQRKAVFILGGPLYGTKMDILCDILRASSFQYVIVISSLSPAMHTIVNYGLGEDEGKTFAEVEDLILEWMGNMVARVTPLKKNHCIKDIIFICSLYQH